MAYTAVATMAVVGTITPISGSLLVAQDHSAVSTDFHLLELQALPTTLAGVTLPQVKEPQWLVDQKAAERAAAEIAGRKAAAYPAQKMTVTYEVATKGTITANLSEFKQQANQTLNDARGWARMGVFFQEVASGGQFTLVLSEASQLPTFSAGCSADYSCNAGRYVIINQDRWLGATASWNAAGGSVRDYRHMVVNHETGHWLGHDHEHCGGSGQAAPVMQQQSIDLEGCTFNPWPLQSELWSSRLGITL
jgi:Protein of unknown function (DUF3152)